ncbi:DUF3883 domain-containing protein [Pontibacter amylolyticus]|uniref:Protein NO VEIN C-terminal domain-containing protein n=1 Tax=Pontibacter amylolyticus TaxID=1424080 RepID=A0ABQ1W9Q4_9BACT|nr:DUF3883 domain-containing protein [Pontibacter amylolyticus]GGG18349.1 hypothetical protein GCM10011323_23160 [Pontibacter amylolyticus]
MELKLIIDKLYQDSKNTPIRGLSAIAEAEKYLQQAYEGRYLFELIQNVRDANKEINQDGLIFIELNDNVLAVSNTGAEFSEKGIEGITTIGQSTKQSQDFIGFKGIGFKAIREITDTPRIVTRYGSVIFDRNLTLKDYKTKNVIESKIPLFYFPHYSPSKLNNRKSENGIVTRIELPLKETVKEEKIIADFNKIGPRQILLLDNISKIEFSLGEYRVKYAIEKDLKRHYVKLTLNDDKVYQYKSFSPKQKVTIPSSIIESLEGKEREIFKLNQHVDINIVVELDDNGHFVPIDKAELYLFYPLEITSGFRFLIHSYFIVNPERTRLRTSTLNNFLLEELAKFISNEMLNHLKRNHKTNTADILCFERNQDAKLDVLYDTLVNELKSKAFIYDSITKRFYKPSDVYAADNFDRGLFPDGKLNNRQLVFFSDQKVHEWLFEEFDVPYLHYDDIANEIEQECRKQLKKKNLVFFQKLYNYVNDHEKFNITGKKVLLTNQWKLVSSDEDVFYIGNEANQIKLGKQVQKHINFIHKEIKLSIREGKSRIGLLEYSKYELVRRLLKLFSNNKKVPKSEVLQALLQIEFDNKSELEVKEKILLPIKGQSDWLQPLFNPIYRDLPELKELYPGGSFVDLDLISALAPERKDIIEFLKIAGVWSIPGVYVEPRLYELSRSDARDKELFKLDWLYSRPFKMQNDVLMDIPSAFTSFFTQSILNNWLVYRNFIQSNLLPEMKYRSKDSGLKTIESVNRLKVSGFVESLKHQKWVSFEGESTTYGIKDVVGIEPLDTTLSSLQILRKYLVTFPISFKHQKDLLRLINICHLNGESYEDYKLILSGIYNRYKTSLNLNKDFSNFYNKILGKLYDYFAHRSDGYEEGIITLKEIHLLGVNELSGEFVWAKGKDLIYIDDKLNYDLLPINIKEKIQPHFTNRDRNTIGRIASRIGKKFSESLTKELVDSSIKKGLLLTDYFELLPESLALLEYHLGTALHTEIDEIKNTRVYIKDNIVINIKVQGGITTPMEVSHFVRKNKNHEIHIIEDPLRNSKKLIAESLNELFILILDRDLRKYNRFLQDFLEREDKTGFLEQYEIEQLRIGEIKDILNSSGLSVIQRFWHTVLIIKNAEQQTFLASKGVRDDVLSNLLSCDIDLIRHFNSSFDFYNQSHSDNIPMLHDLFMHLGISLGEFNELAFPKINFQAHYARLLNSYIDGYENQFDKFLYNHLLGTGIDEKSRYQDYLDTYKRGLNVSISSSSLYLNVEELFVEQIMNNFPFLTLTSLAVFNTHIQRNVNAMYAKSYSKLRKLLEKGKIESKYLDEFLSYNRFRSLLYFGEVIAVVDAYKDWISNKSDSDNVSQNGHSGNRLAETLSQFINENGASIESVQTKSVGNRRDEGVGVNGSGGRRGDGGSFDESRQMIGLVAEKVVYDKLCEEYDSVRWESKNATKAYPELFPEGDDKLGYDISYKDKEGNRIYVEVKGKSDNQKLFEIKKNELDKALKFKENYKVIFVSNVLDNKRRRMLDLGNLFILENGHDFFNNNKFSARYKNFEIYFN